MRTTRSSATTVDVDLDRDGGIVLAAVLDGVHGRLADGGLEPLQAGLGQGQRGDGLGHAVHGLALVALLAGEDDVEQAASARLDGRACLGLGGSGVAVGESRLRGHPVAPQGDHGDVVLLLPAAADEGVELVEDGVDDLAAAAGRRPSARAGAGSRTCRRPARAPR